MFHLLLGKTDVCFYKDEKNPSRLLSEKREKPASVMAWGCISVRGIVDLICAKVVLIQG